MNLRAVVQVLGFLLVVTAACLVVPAAVSFGYGEGDGPAFLVTALVGAVAGGACLAAGRGAGDLRAREGFAVVTLGWLVVGVLGAAPYVATGAIPDVTDAVFESISGFTTTGATILRDIEGQSHAVLFWRALTHWLGGMGIVLLALAILPLLGVGGMQLYRAEVPSPTPDRLTPRIRQTAKLLWGVYVLLTALETLALWLAGLSLFDAVCHGFATMATGGFSTRDASVGAYQSAAVEWIVVVFMFLAGTNFTLHYLALRGRGRVYFRDEELRFFVKVLVGFSVVIAVLLLAHGLYSDVHDALRDAVFQVVAIATTTGFGTADYLLWPPFAAAGLLVLMAMGGCAGSTGGGIKVMRIIVLLKHAKVEMVKLLHPRAVYNLWFNERSLSPGLATNVLGFFLLYMLMYLAGVLVLTLGGRDLVTAVGATAATLSNIGPGLGEVGPASNYAGLVAGEKWLLIFFMLTGRLEIYTVLVLLLPEAWRRS
ncbi:MAG: potassium transporter TrkG [Candidatus Krumholzibacteriia bacterium]